MISGSTKREEGINKIFAALSLVWMLSHPAFPQCQLQSEMNANGTLSKVTKPEVIYYNKKVTFYSSVKFDGVDFYFDWVIRPFDKEKVKSESMRIQLDNGSEISLDFYDSYTNAKDSSQHLLYRIHPKAQALLKKYKIHDIRMRVDEKERYYILKLHKDVLRKQIQCILASENKETK